MTLCFIVPFYNEASRINQEYFENLVDVDADLIFVDDGSSDETLTWINHFSQLNTKVKALSLPTNQGKSEAIRVGINFALDLNSYQGIGYLDADGAVSILDVEDLIQHFRGLDSNYEAVWKSRVFLSGRVIHRTWMRHWISRAIATSFGLIVPSMPYDTQCGLKLFRVTEVFRESVETPFSTRWFLDLEIYTRVGQLKKSVPTIYEVPCNHWREISKSRIGFLSFFEICKSYFYIVRKLYSIKNFIK
jgi:glycosyltransferase involved in cell wall biosynthesis